MLKRLMASKVKMFKMAMVGLMFAMSGVAMADHNDGGRYGNVRNRAYELNQVVQWSGLRWNVQNAVSRLAQSTSQLDDRFMVPTQPMQPASLNRFDHNDGGSNNYVIQQIRSEWYEVERYLYDTNYDYPQVYRAYRNLRHALRQAGI